MKAEIHQFVRKQVETNWMCSVCGVDASCNCGAPLMSKASRAREMKGNDPEKAIKDIARELEMDPGNVRQALGGKNRGVPHPLPNMPDENTWPDAFRSSATDPIQEDCADCSGPADEWRHSLSNMAGDAISAAAFWSRRFGDWNSFETPSELVELAKQAAEAWSKIASELERK
jgi:hypothetical protein